MYHIITCFKLTSNMKIHPLKIRDSVFQKLSIMKLKDRIILSRARLKGHLYAELHLPECSVPLCPSQGCRPVIGYRGAVKGVGGIIR